MLLCNVLTNRLKHAISTRTVILHALVTTRVKNDLGAVSVNRALHRISGERKGVRFVCLFYRLGFTPAGVRKGCMLS